MAKLLEDAKSDSCAAAVLRCLVCVRNQYQLASLEVIRIELGQTQPSPVVSVYGLIEEVNSSPFLIKC